MSRVAFMDLRARLAMLRPELDRAIGDILDGGQFIFGDRVEEFEQSFGVYCGGAEAVGVASGTDAITIALAALGVGGGDEVITVANTCVPTVAGIEATGATAVLVDVDAETFTLDPAALPAALTERTRAVVPVHLYGQCADMEPIVAFARAHGLAVVEDAAQAHGAEYRGGRAGTLGDAAAFSFYPTKNLGALGDAGAVVTRDPVIAERARLLRNYGELGRYNSVLRGWNSRLDTLQAAILLVSLGHLESWTARRREVASRYAELLSDVGIGVPTEAPGRLHVYHLFVVRVHGREAFREALAAEGVDTLVHYSRPIHKQPAYATIRIPDAGLPVAERLCAEVVSLPLHPELADDEVDAVGAAVERAAFGTVSP